MGGLPYVHANSVVPEVAVLLYKTLAVVKVTDHVLLLPPVPERSILVKLSAWVAGKGGGGGEVEGQEERSGEGAHIECKEGKIVIRRGRGGGRDQGRGYTLSARKER